MRASKHLASKISYVKYTLNKFDSKAWHFLRLRQLLSADVKIHCSRDCVYQNFAFTKFDKNTDTKFCSYKEIYYYDNNNIVQ